MLRNMERMNLIFKHLNLNSTVEKSLARNAASSTQLPTFRSDENDIVVVSALRSPLCKAKRGHLKDTFPDDLLSIVFNAVLKETKLDPQLLGDICVGNVSNPRASLDCRAAQFYSNIPETVPLSVVNRQCSSGLQAFMDIAGGINNGAYDIGLAAGLECMTRNPMMNKAMADDLNPRLFEVPLAKDLLYPMGITSENVAAKFGISRRKQDEFALESQAKAAKARDAGLFKNETVPVKTVFTDASGTEREITVTEDDGIRKTTMEGLAKLKPAFQEGGSTTAGNSSQMTDGAAAVLVAKRSAAREHQLPVLAILRAYAVVGCPPSIMGIGPAVAIPVALKKAGLTIDDIEIFEINEAFASQASYCVEKLGIPSHKVNPKGGAIAIGHPLGCTGARMIATLLHELKRRGKRSFGVVSMCMGSGMGAAAVFEYPGY